MSQKVTQGEDFLLNCQPPISTPVVNHMVWYCNFKKIPVMENQRFIVLSNNSLHVKNVTVFDGGEYFCEAVNSFSGVARTSTKATITVQGGYISSCKQFKDNVLYS